jgi:hypothetical protein
MILFAIIALLFVILIMAFLPFWAALLILVGVYLVAYAGNKGWLD